MLAPFAVGDVTYPLARKGAYATEQVAGAISGRNLLHRNVLTSQHQQRTAQAPNEEIKRRTRVVRIFPNPASCLRLVRALCAEVHEGWLEDHRYLNMEYLKEQKKELRTAA